MTEDSMAELQGQSPPEWDMNPGTGTAQVDGEHISIWGYVT